MNKREQDELAEVLSSTDDLDQVIRLVARERAIRDTMNETSETHEIVADMIDAMGSMSEEAVLDLTDGEPTTLRDALSRYVESLERYPNGVHTDTVAAELTALLNHPWPSDGS